jgi:molecular chaperone IbpA
MASTLEKRDNNRSIFPSFSRFFPDLRAWSVGFDRDWDMLDELKNTLIKATLSYPPYNIKKVNDNKYEIEMAVAGFSKPDLKVEVKNDQLIVEGSKKTKEESRDVDYVYKGIASRHFRQSFALADHLKVISSEFKDGILTIHLEGEMPEEKKGQQIEIH